VGYSPIYPVGNVPSKRNVLRVLDCHAKTLRMRINGDCELRGQPAHPSLTGKWPLKMATVCKTDKGDNIKNIYHVVIVVDSNS